MAGVDNDVIAYILYINTEQEFRIKLPNINEVAVES